jgi:hypothetical protein
MASWFFSFFFFAANYPVCLIRRQQNPEKEKNKKLNVNGWTWPQKPYDINYAEK